MKGVNQGSWAPAQIIVLTLIPILVLFFVTYIAIKCTTWAPALRFKFRTWGNKTWITPRFILRHKRNASDSTGEELRERESRI